ncbi:MAG: alpha-amylase family glycosyl hydrolase [Candidatus Saccharimonas sp.]
MKTWRDISALYQIYPRSFRDTNGDGVGDINGIIEKLDYLVELNIEAIWLSPIYLSPQADCGYDITDYYTIDPLFGTMRDMEKLIAQCHERGLKIVMDYVPNHTSDQHAWFMSAKASKHSPYRNYYVWRDPKPDGSAPTNWVSMAGGSSWTFDEASGQYYLHSFMSSQPDLNWDNPAVRSDMHDVLRFWLDKGIDGFRVDASWPISKVLKDDPVNEQNHDSTNMYARYVHTSCQQGPHMLRYMREMTDVVASYRDRFMIFEYYTSPEYGDEIDQYAAIASLNPSVAAPFVFDLFRLDWHADDRSKRMERLYAQLPRQAYPVHCLGNHDQSRVRTRFGHMQARALALVQLSLPGLPTVYYGDEIGMSDYQVATSDKRDNFTEGGGMGGRDPERTPMRWQSSKNAGFSTAKPWLPIGDKVESINVEAQLAKDDSYIVLYQQLLHLRKQHAALRTGRYESIPQSGYCLAYRVRGNGGRSFVVAMNFSDQPQAAYIAGRGAVIVSSQAIQRHSYHQDSIDLQPYEAVLLDQG